MITVRLVNIHHHAKLRLFLVITFVFSIMYLIFFKCYADKIKQNQWYGECPGVRRGVGCRAIL